MEHFQLGNIYYLRTTKIMTFLNQETKKKNFYKIQFVENQYHLNTKLKRILRLINFRVTS